jgi:hypothetical protein
MRFLCFLFLISLVNASCGSPTTGTPQAERKRSKTTEDTCLNYVSSQKIKTKKTYSQQNDSNVLSKQEVLDINGKLIYKVTFVYSGKNIYEVEREHHSYTQGNHTKMVYTGSKDDSTLIRREVEHVQNGVLVKKEFFEGLNSAKKMNSTVTYQYKISGNDSIITEQYNLYNNDVMFHTYVFKNKKIFSHSVTSNGKPYSEEKYFYDTEGRLAKKTEEEKLWNTSSTEEFFFENGFKSRSTMQKNLGNNQRGVYYYTYDKKGNETSVEYKLFVGKYESGMGHHKTKTSYFYIDCMLMEEEITNKIGLTETLLKTSYEYTFY